MGQTERITEPETADGGQKKGVIIKGVGGLYRVSVQNLVFSCKPRGILRKKKLTPMIGDTVLLSECSTETLTAVMDDILPRRNALIRPAVANVDRILFVVAAETPAPDLLLLDRMLAFAALQKIQTVLVVNKKDQNPDAAARLAGQYRNAAGAVLTVSAKTGGEMDALRALLRGGISVLAGQSGVGKSSLLNRMIPELSAATGSLSEKSERGRHTTRHSEIFQLEDGFLIDSPGFSLFELDGIPPETLQTLYPEIENHRGVCRYMDCSHTGEPGCFVPSLLAAQQFDGGRYERYRILYRELKEKEKNRYR